MEEKINVIKGSYDKEADEYGEVTFDGKVLDPKASQKVYNHSPDGFAWGYSGSGPAQLSLAIMLAAGLSQPRAIRLYQRFKAQFISRLQQQEDFTLELDIHRWIAEMEKVS